MSKPNKNKIYLSSFLLIFCMLLFTALYGCGTGPDVAAGSTQTTAASLDLSASPTTVKSDNSNTTTITVTALNASHAAVPGVTVIMGSDTGILSGETVTTDTTGKATLTFSSGESAINRTATITATSGTVSAQSPVQIVGSSITLTSTGGTLPDTGLSPVTLTVTALDASGNPVEAAAVALTSTPTGTVTITPASGVTLGNGKFTATVAGVAAGTVTLTAAALGATATTTVTVTTAGATFSIDQQTLNGSIITNNPNPTAMKIGDSLIIRVNAPSSANVTFAATTGVWNGLTSAETVAVSGGKATATLTTTQAGIANVQVYDSASPSTSDTITVAMTSGAVANNITLQAVPTTVPKSVGTTTGSSTLIATVRDIINQPIGSAPVSFSIVNPTSGGETVSPVVVLTGVDGKASASFTSGSLPSTGDGVKVRAAVVGTAVKTGTAPSGNDAAIIISGGAGSIAFGQATVLAVDETKSNYIQAMSVLVANVAGQAVAGQVVSLSLWPIAWSTGTVAVCAYDTDDGASRGTFLNEDVNENLILDPNLIAPGFSEDGTRTYYATAVEATGTGTKDASLTPVNSAAGTVPATVTTGANGVAGFNLIYPKDSAIWTVIRIRASTNVDGTETVSQRIFRLPALTGDVSPCLLSCPYVF